MSHQTANGDQIKWETQGQEFHSSASALMPNYAPSAPECYSNTNSQGQPFRNDISSSDSRGPEPDPEGVSKHTRHHSYHSPLIHPNHFNHIQHPFHPIDTSKMYHYNGQENPAVHHTEQEELNDHSTAHQYTGQEDSNGQFREEGGEEHNYQMGHARLDSMMADQLGLTRTYPSNFYPSNAYPSNTHLSNADMGYHYYSDNNPYNNGQGMQSPEGDGTITEPTSADLNSPLSIQGPHYANTPQSMHEPRSSYSPQFIQGHQYPNPFQPMQKPRYVNAPLPISPASTDRRGSYQPLRPYPAAPLDSQDPQDSQETGSAWVGFSSLPNFESIEGPNAPAEEESGNESGSEKEIESESEPPQAKISTKSRSAGSTATTQARKKHHNEVEKSYRVRLNDHIDALQKTVFGEFPEEIDKEQDGSKSKLSIF